MKALIIFALIALISCDSDEPEIDYDVSFECPDDKKIKIGEDVCAIASSQSATSPIEAIVYIKKKCGKNKGCFERDDKYNKVADDDDIIFTCQKKIKYLKIGKKCNYHAECYTGFCNNGKCAVYDENECDDDENCGPGKYCYNEKCSDYVKAEGTCDGNELKCAHGYGCYYAKDSTSTGVCKKYFSLEKATYSTNPFFCSSFFVSSNRKYADIVSVDADCSVKYNDGNEDTMKSDTYSNLYVSVNDKKYCLYSSGGREFLGELKKRYNKIKLDKVLEKEYCDYGADKALCDKKFAELWAVYKNYGNLLYHGLIKENGEKNKDKKCEYEFWKSTISSSYVNACFGFAFALLGLLF